MNIRKQLKKLKKRLDVFEQNHTEWADCVDANWEETVVTLGTLNEHLKMVMNDQDQLKMMLQNTDKAHAEFVHVFNDYRRALNTDVQELRKIRTTFAQAIQEQGARLDALSLRMDEVIDAFTLVHTRMDSIQGYRPCMKTNDDAVCYCGCSGYDDRCDQFMACLNRGLDLPTTHTCVQLPTTYAESAGMLGHTEEVVKAVLRAAEPDPHNFPAKPKRRPSMRGGC